MTHDHLTMSTSSFAAPMVFPPLSLAAPLPEDLDLAVPAFLLDEALEQDGERAAPNAVQEVEGDFRERLDLGTEV